MEIYELNTFNDSRKSFYGKAQVVEYTNHEGSKELVLFSYNTEVAKIIKNCGKFTYIYYGKYSSTTTRHQKEFFKQNGLNDDEIKMLFKSGELIKVL